ncbi:MAG: sialate O-acetylesterase [Kiritimatiellia bacterium]
MNKTIIYLLLTGLLITLASPGFAADEIKIPAKEKFHLFLMVGQSNMAGRGKIGKQDKVAHPRVLLLSKKGKWKPAVAPLHYDKPGMAGVCLGKSFALMLADKNPDVTIGLIPAACGGSSITSWVPGGYHEQTESHPYDDAVRRTVTALKSGVLKGILWHQGEADCGSVRAAGYEQQLKELILRFRSDLNQPELPFIIGQLGQFPERPWSKGRRTVDLAQKKVAFDLPFCAFVSSEDLKPKSDNVHFNAKSLRELGKRYAEAYSSIVTTEDCD